MRWSLIVAVSLIVSALVGCGGGSQQPEGSAGTDPYLWLEELDSAQVRDWVDAQNSKTLAVLEQDPRYADNLAQAVDLGNAPDRLPTPSVKDGVVGNFWQDPKHPRGIWRETSVPDYESPEPHWKTVLDVDALAKAEGRNWVWKGSHCDPVTRTRCLVELSEGGEDAVTLREFDRTAGQFVAGGFVLERAKQYAAWLDRDTLLVSREWAPGQVTASGYPYIVKRWQRGQPMDQAVEVARGDPADELSTSPLVLDNAEGRQIALVERRPSFFTNEDSVVADGRLVRLALPPKSDVKDMVGNQVLVELKEDWTVDSSTFRAGSLVALDADEMLREPQRLRPTLVYAPGPQDALQGMMTTRDRVIVTSLYDVKGRATVFTRRPDGSWSAQPIDLPDNATVKDVSADPRGDLAYVSVSTMLDPTTLYHVDAPTGRATAVKSSPARFDSSRFVVEQMKATSTDGTPIPYFVVHAADMPYDGTTPTIVWAYGGFGKASTPGYDGLRGRLWLERGGAFVIANIRGGDEYGPAWHEAATKTQRQKSFDDFAAVAGDLIARNITSPRHLGIQGGSNGGLLVGVEFVQHPDLFNAVDMQIPLLDMERYEQIAAGASWVGEYGSMQNSDERAFLESISPYANVQRGVTYPTALIWTTSKDDRVGPQHARKFAARLAEYGIPYLFYEATEGGHGGGTNADERARTAALEYTYFQRQLM